MKKDILDKDFLENKKYNTYFFSDLYIKEPIFVHLNYSQCTFEDIIEASSVLLGYSFHNSKEKMESLMLKLSIYATLEGSSLFKNPFQPHEFID